MNEYLLSIIIPTRNRPECIDMCLRSIVVQNLTGVEVLVADNGTEILCEEVVHKYCSYGVKYYKTDKDYHMKGSFEYAVGLASGKWVMLLNDKSLLYHLSIPKLVTAIQKQDPDILNFPLNFFSPFDSRKSLRSGKVEFAPKTGASRKIDTQEALKNHFACNNLCGDLGDTFQIGTIFMGIYKRELIGHIKELHESGLLFDGAVPDRYLTIEALYITDNVWYLDDDIIIYNACGRNTWNLSRIRHRDEIIEPFKNIRCGEANVDHLIIPDVYMSLSNILATDYRMANDYITKKLNLDIKHKIEKEKVAALAYFEIKKTKVPKDIKKIEMDNLKRFIDKLDKDQKAHFHMYVNGIKINRNTNKTIYKKVKRIIADLIRKVIMSDVPFLSNAAFHFMQKCLRSAIVTMDIYQQL